MPPSLVSEHFFAPCNVGDIENADGSGTAGSLFCGAALRVSLEVDEAQRISAAKFRVAGCSYLVATCSILSAAIVGETTGDAAALCQTPEALIRKWDYEWPADKTECAAL
ncbi:MAG TPA: iron-sulfur cluster assembly scaffold protein, partial [Pyrinomonadaceae bacterium]|nr:iron-sulfur cluster assembly scaffold protein [Pyrinomonadaceae bacterium]